MRERLRILRRQAHLLEVAGREQSAADARHRTSSGYADNGPAAVLLSRFGVLRDRLGIELVDLVDQLVGVGSGRRRSRPAGDFLGLHQLGDAVPLRGEVLAPLDAGGHLVAAEARLEDDARLLQGFASSPSGLVAG